MLTTRIRGCLACVEHTLDRCTILQRSGTVGVILAHLSADSEAELLVQRSGPGVFLVTLPPVTLSGVVLTVTVVPASTSVPPSLPPGR